MSVTKSSQNQFNNSQIHFGTGDNVGKNKIKSKYSEKMVVADKYDYFRGVDYRLSGF